MTNTEGFGSTYTPPASEFAADKKWPGDEIFSSTPTTTPTTTPASQWSAPTSTPTNTGTDTGTSSDTKDVAKDQAANVAGGAADAAKNVAGTAKEQAGQVATEAKKQVKDLVGQARSELTDQATVQQERVASGLKSVGDQIRQMAEGSEQTPATDIAHQAADKIHEVASWLENRDPGTVLDDVRAFAQKRPGAFLAIALGAGVVVGRLAKGLAADSDASSTAPAKPALNASAWSDGR